MSGCGSKAARHRETIIERANTGDDSLACAYAAIAQDNLSGAKIILTRLVGEPMCCVQAEHALAVVERRLGNLQSSKAHFECVLRAAPRDPEVLNNVVHLAITLKNAGQLDDAQAMAVRVTELAPGFAKAWHALGVICWQRKRLDAAAAALEHALRLMPHDATLLHARARVEAERGGAALPFYERALAILPDDPELVLGTGVARCEAGNIHAAIETLQHLATVRPDWTKGHAALAQLLWQSGNTEAFTDSFERALRCRPTDLTLLIAYFGTLMRAGQYAKVLGSLTQARTMIAAEELFDRYEAVCASESGDLARAERAFSRQPPGNDHEFDLARIRHLLRTKRFFQAAAAAERLTCNSDCGTAAWSYLSLAWRLTADPRQRWLEDTDRCVQTFDCRQLLPELSQLGETLRLGHHGAVHPFGQSARGGTQSDGNLFLYTNSCLERLRACMEFYVAQYMARLPPADSVHPFLRPRGARTGLGSAYSIWLRSGGYHAHHMHPHAWISGCLYVQLPTSLGSSATDPAGWLVIGAPPAELGLDLEPVLRVRPEPGKFALFPSMMWHGSLPFPRGERLTVVADFPCQL